MEVCLRGMGAILWSPYRDVIPVQMGPRQGVLSCLLTSEIPKGGAKLALSEGRKQQLDDFQAAARLYCVRATREKNANFAP